MAGLKISVKSGNSLLDLHPISSIGTALYQYRTTHNTFVNSDFTSLFHIHSRLGIQVRREKISERMRLLQGLVPGCDKVIGKELALDEIINYVQVAVEREESKLTSSTEKEKGKEGRLDVMPLPHELLPRAHIGTQHETLTSAHHALDGLLPELASLRNAPNDEILLTGCHCIHNMQMDRSGGGRRKKLHLSKIYALSGGEASFKEGHRQIGALDSQ
ncbi:hypothetical protein Syun_020797 [Stephania yunnanensis]|uniref:BHLH domain-containing protein n=1 Tax=Stephania yunnanensis TaxID=152371 RepID=A0AAP0IF48_9MAGN